MGSDAEEPLSKSSPKPFQRRLVRAGRAILASSRGKRGYDPYALDRRDAEVVSAVSDVFEWLNRRYFGLRVDGLEQVDPDRPVLFVANHNGGIMGPDLSCTLGTLWSRLGADAPLYCMAHDFAMRRLTPLGRVLQSVGAMRADPRSAAAVLGRGGSVLVYPGGDLDAYRLSRLRNQVVFGDRVGFIRVARDAGVPIVPVVAEGAHRSAYIFHEGESLARWLRLDEWSRIRRFPVAFALPWGIAAGPWVPYLPLPLPIQLRFLAPIDVSDERSLGDAQAHVVSSMQLALDELVARRARGDA